MTRRQRIRGGLVAPVVAVLAACQPPEPPVGRLQVAPAAVDLRYPAFEEIEIRLSPSDELAALTGAPRVFVHLLTAPGEVARTFDHPLPDPWRPGEEQSYTVKLYQSALGPPLDAGDYPLTVGLYDEAGRRWPLDSGGEEVDTGEYVVARVRVPEEDAGVPMFYFSPGWQTIEGGVDEQILGRRWLVGAGEIRVGEISEAGRVWMRLAIPPVETADHRLQIEDGAEHPLVLVSTSCGDLEICAAGPGSHFMELPIVPGADGALPGECVIRLRPNYHMVALANPQQQLTLQLENLAWGPPRDEG